MDRERFHFDRRVNFPWLIKMAIRDSRRNRSRLLLFISSIILGIAALVSSFSFEYNLKKDVDEQAKELVGADLVVYANKVPDKNGRSLLDTLGEEKSEERTFASMVYFQKSGGTRLVQVRALEGGYPYYGEFETQPASAGRSFLKGQEALVDKTLMLQFDAKVGDSIKVGDLYFSIAGVLNKMPGRSGISTTIAPPVFIPLKYLEETQLLKKGSRIAYTYYFKFSDDVDVEKSLQPLGPKFDKLSLDYDTVESRKRNTDRAFADFSEFLALISFVALLLGCMGVASSIHIYIKEKINSIAILRCLGMQGRQAFLIYLIQVVGIGFIGSVLGAMLGSFIQQFLPAVFKDFLPVDVHTSISFRAILQGIALGVFISVLFGLLPLISIRKISPLNAIRLSFEPAVFLKDPLRWLVYFLIVSFIFSFTFWQIHHWKQALVFTFSVFFGLAILASVAKILMWLVRHFFPRKWPYVWRQGFSNLYRPNNQTLILIITIGLGTAFIATLYFVQAMLMDRVTLSDKDNQANMVLFDIQTGQKSDVNALASRYHLPLLQEVPVVTMRIEEINGKNVEIIRKDSTDSIPIRVFENELRVTYRDSLINSEKIVAGKLGENVDSGDIPKISLDERYARSSHLKIGDKVLFNVQGMMMMTEIGSYRSVDWRRVQTNFRIVFPTGVLEKAPQFHVLITHVPSSEVSAKFQQAVVREYPNVSIIDLGLVIGVMTEILDKIGFVIRFMAGFSIITGLVVLVSSVLISKFQRIQESVLLRTLGATRKQILFITGLEYLFLGSLAAATGIVLALAASWGLAKFSIDTVFRPHLKPMVIIFLSIVVLTIVIGLMNIRSVIRKPPLEILRREG